MSNIINKIKEAVTGEPHPTTTNTTTTDAYNTTGTTGNTYATGTTGTTGTAEGVTGPHSSRLANAMDPRVDSDRDGSARLGGTTAGNTYGNTGTSTGVTGNTYNTGTVGTTTGTAEGTAGPHNSRLANALDPRVDSDLDGSNRVGTGAAAAGAATTAGTHHHHHGHHHGHHAAGTTGVTGSTYETGNTYGTGATGATTTGTTTGTTGGLGPHSSSLLNKLDPRVDSTTGAVKTSGTTGATGTTGTTGTYGNTSSYPNTGTTGGLSHSTNAGPHDSNLANKLDPRVDSDLDGRGNRHGANTGGVFGASGSHATPGSGTAQNTAGPHNSDLMNKLDPRVDSDMDGSTTVGSNRTRAGIGSERDPTDAAHVPPSVLREQIGHPTITHGNPEDNFQGRHGSIATDQSRHL